MNCERCGDAEVTHVPDHPVIPWSGLGLCCDCYEAWVNDEFEVAVNVTEME